MLIIHGNYENKVISIFSFVSWFIEFLSLVLTVCIAIKLIILVIKALWNLKSADRAVFFKTKNYSFPSPCIYTFTESHFKSFWNIVILIQQVEN